MYLWIDKGYYNNAYLLTYYFFALLQWVAYSVKDFSILLYIVCISRSPTNRQVSNTGFAVSKMFSSRNAIILSFALLYVIHLGKYTSPYIEKNIYIFYEFISAMFCYWF